MNYLLFSFKNLRKRGIRSWLTLLGVFIGIAAVISLMTLGAGLKTAIVGQFGVSSTEIITVQAGGLSYGPPGSDVTTPLTIQDVQAIEKISSVDYAIPRNVETVKLEYNERVVFTMALSVQEGFEKEIYDIFEIEAREGRLLKNGDYKKVILGYDYGDEKKGGFEKRIEAKKKILIQDEKFEVVGILEKKGSFIMDKAVFIYDNDLKQLMKYGDDVDVIAVKVKSKDLIDKAKEDIEKLLRKRRNVKVGEEDFEVATPEAMLETINSILGGVQAFIVIIAFISIIVGAIGIINTMTTSVVERKKEIGIMKAIGAKNKHIFFQFFIESGVLGLVGGIAGIVFGLLVGYLGTIGINNFVGASTKPEINFVLIILSLIGSFLIGAVAGIIPAMGAAKQNPVEALRN
ncbi:ABC transporter permease [Candidatus Pacearchaeota archaeon]|nr:ABC transporter permease [Candidatus Pacearchaeota archaeon]